jgi:hypothetical protein
MKVALFAAMFLSSKEQRAGGQAVRRSGGQAVRRYARHQPRSDLDSASMTALHSRTSLLDPEPSLLYRG